MANIDDINLSSADESESERADEGTSTNSGWHPVWKLFRRFVDLKGKKKIECLAPDKKGNQCKEILSDGSSTVAMRHLKRHHQKEYKAKEEERKKIKLELNARKKGTDGGLVQRQLSVQRISTKYPLRHAKQMDVTRKLAKAFVAKSLPTRLIENEEFRDVLTTLDEKYDPPSSYFLKKEEAAMFESMRKSLSLSLERATKIAITADIWTKRGGTESFFGVTAHWYDKKVHRLMAATLAIRNLTGTHDAKCVYDQTIEVLASWSIPLTKISKVVTDNGSNMVKAFQEAFQFANMQNSSPADDGDDEDLEEIAAVGDWHLEESYIEADDASIDLEISEFNTEEQEINAAFERLERLSCFAHSLQCSIRNLDKSAFTCFSRKAAFKLMNSFAHSPKATQLLHQKVGKKLLTGCKTRWSYNCLALELLLELKTAVTEVTEELQTIDNLTNSQWSDIERYVKFTKPFANATYSIEGNLYATIPDVIPALLNLNHHLEETRNIRGYKTAAETLILEIQERFAYILDPMHQLFDPIYVIATALDPRVRLVLTHEQIDIANREIVTRLTVLNAQAAAENLDVEHRPLVNPMEGQEGHDYVAQLIQQRQRGREEYRQNPLAEEVQSYWGSNHMLDRKADPLGFWKDHQQTYPNLALLAQEILAIPATSAPVERLFSQASIAISGRRNRLSGRQLEQEVMLKTNKMYF